MNLKNKDRIIEIIEKCIDDIYYSLYTNNIKNVNNMIIELANNIEKFTDYVKYINEKYEIQVNYIKIMSQLNFAVESLSRVDYVLVADILKYEIGPEIKNIVSEINKMIEVDNNENVRS